MDSEIRPLLPTTYYLLPYTRRGQSLMEVVIGIAVGTLMVLAAITVIAAVLRGSSDVNRMQAGAALGKQLLESVRVFGEGDWHNLDNLATSSLQHYYLNTSSSPFAAVAGDEAVMVATTTYTRYFYVDDVGRDAGGNIVVSGGANDPSTKKISVTYFWPRSAVKTMTTYLTRSRNMIFWQTDWSGGAGQNGPATTTNNRFASSSNVNFTTSTGSLYLNLP